MNILVILPHVQLILVPLWELQSTFICHILDNTNMSSKQLQINSSFKSEELMESTLKLMIIFMISQTKEDLVDQKLIWFKICTTELKLWLLEKRNSDHPSKLLPNKLMLKKLRLKNKRLLFVDLNLLLQKLWRVGV